MSNKRFVYFSIFISLVFIITISQLIYYSTTTNTLYMLSQKRVSQTHGDEKIIFLGGSTLEYGLDATYFSKLSGIKTANLSLTATAHNLSATYNMLRHTIQNNKNVKVIVIMHTPFVWSEEFSLGGYCSTLNELDSTEALSINLLNKLDCFNYHFGNFEAIKTKYRQSKKQNYERKTYKNGGLNIFKEMEENKFSKLSQIGSKKEYEIKMINDYVKDKNITLIYVQGSLHYQLSEKYAHSIKLQQDILNKQKNIIFIQKYLYPKNENMGNTENHVHNSYKKTSTKFYFDLISPYIERHSLN